MNIAPHVTDEMRYALIVWRRLKSNWIISLSEKFSILLVVLSLVLLVSQWNNLPPEVPLWYNKPWGGEQLADPRWLFILPAMSIAIYLLNSIVSVYLVSDYLIFTQMISLTTFITSFLSCITFIKILFLVR